MTSPDARPARAAAGCAVAGAVALVAGTVLHPARALPRDAVAAFTEYAADPRWQWWLSHLLQLAGVVTLVLAVLLLTDVLAPVARRVVGALGAAGVAVALVLQGVDGVALKAMTDLWAGAQDPRREALFAGALAVRQVEIGLDAVLGLCLGALLLAAGAGWAAARAVPGWLAAAVLLAGAVQVATGVLLGLDGYSDAAMLGTTVAGPLALLAVTVVAVRAARAAGRPG